MTPDTPPVTPWSESPRDQAEGHRRLSAAVIHETIRVEGESELQRPVRSLLWSGLAAGLSMGFSLTGEGLLRAHLPVADWRVLVESLGYTAGFVFVVLGRQQLFTENTLTVVLPVFHDRTGQALGRMLRLWAVVLAANTVGTLLFALAAAYGGIFGPEVRDAFTEIGREATGHGTLAAFLKAIVAGWLIALMVWLLPGSGSAGIVVIIGVTYLVALADLSHIIAGSVEGFYVVAVGARSMQAFVLDFFLPTLLGNILGGVTLVALLNHAQVRDEL